MKPTKLSESLCDGKKCHKERQLLRCSRVNIGRICVLDCSYWKWGVSSSMNQKQKIENSETEKVAEFKIWNHFKCWGVLFCTEGSLRYESGVLNQSNKFLHCLFPASWWSRELAQDQQINYSIIFTYKIYTLILSNFFNIYQLMHNWIVLKTILKFPLKLTLKQLQHVSV